MDYIGTIEKDNKLTGEAQIIIYGAGKVGKHALEVLQKSGFGGNVVCFCDNNKNLIRKSIQGVSVYSVEGACILYPKGTYLVASMCVRQMVESLLQYGIEHIHIIRESPV